MSKLLPDVAPFRYLGPVISASTGLVTVVSKSVYVVRWGLLQTASSSATVDHTARLHRAAASATTEEIVDIRIFAVDDAQGKGEGNPFTADWGAYPLFFLNGVKTSFSFTGSASERYRFFVDFVPVP